MLTPEVHEDTSPWSYLARGKLTLMLSHLSCENTLAPHCQRSPTENLVPHFFPLVFHPTGSWVAHTSWNWSLKKTLKTRTDRFPAATAASPGTIHGSGHVTYKASRHVEGRAK